MNRNASINNAVHGAAFGGHVELTIQLITRGANLNNAVSGAASGGHIELSHDLIRRGGSLNLAVQAAAGGGFIELVNDLIERGAELKYAVRGVATWEHTIKTEQEALHYLSFIRNAKLRRLLADKLHKKTIPSLDIKKLLTLSENLNHLMNANKMTFNQAQALLKADN